MKTFTKAAVGLAAIAVTSLVRADNMGPWEDEGTVFTAEIYVSYDNGDDADPTGSLGLDPNQPLATITNAISVAQNFFLNGGVPVTINVEPGTPIGGALSGEYDPDHGEVFPLTIPAFGLALEGLSAGVTIDGADSSGASSSLLISVSSLGDDTLPPSVVRGFTLQGATNGMNIAPGSGGNLASPPIELQVRDCRFLDIFAAIRISTPPNRFSEIVVERNLFTGTQRLSTAIEETNFGRSSNLYRANDISNFEFAIVSDNVGAPADNRVRFMSNFIQLAVTCMDLNGCNAVVANNTVAYAVNFSTDLTVKGLEWDGTSLDLFNNIFYSPKMGSGADLAIDLDLTGMVNDFNNAVEDRGDPMPDFVSGNTHPGLLNPVDLHLAPASAMIGFGDLTRITGTPENPIPLIYGDTSALQNTTRADINMDIDGDPRVLFAPGAEGTMQVDAGADEVARTRLSLSGVPNQDGLGNVSRNAMGEYEFTFTTSGAPGQAYGVLYSLVFVDTATSGGTLVRNGALYSNSLVPGAGNFLLEDDFGLNAAASGLETFTGAGTGGFTFNLGSGPTGIEEAELYFQMISFDAQGRFIMSNRVGVELNP